MSQLYYIADTARHQLQTWLSHRSDAAGVLWVEENGVRYFQDIQSGEKHLLTAGPKEKRTYKLGEERLSATAYETVADLITEAPGSPQIKWLVIDGVGPMELRKEGLHLLMENMLLGALPGVNVVLVIAGEAVEKVLKRYQLKGRIMPFSFPE